ncbi:molybdenum ABC transporter ATP-binding protein [Roseitranquillus sediminis]|uniref:molybdenum ABC transporter ATP-binding protein n=1 Tax=Roseitranquillus sediminis TaxID=2809051 RepID=UPI001D0CB386|nr:molybdenum ABC transporter ATP-binding protein [Roseitranquillus sediminis]MBM9593785.1 molybdenum ABC transporter ATP-binding protein [Roseitranquillus sediminis]
MTLDVALSHRFKDFALDVAFEAPAGVTVLFGRSGSGKTTVANALAGLLRPQSGRASINGTVLFDTAAGVWLPPHLRRVGYVFQEGRLFPHLTVRRNLLYGRWFARGAADGASFERVVRLLGLEHLLARRPGALSGGEKQRVALGRALLSRPQLLLMDEPLAALDEARKAEILPYLERIRDQTEVPILYVSHSVAEVARLATTVVALDRGRVVRAGPAAAVLSDPEAVPTLGVREAGAMLVGRVVRHHPDGLTEVALSAGPIFMPRLEVEPGVSLRIRIEAKDVIVARGRPEGLSALNILPAEVATVRRGAGGGVIVQFRAGQDLLLARVTRRSADALELIPGAACHLVMKSVAVAQADIGEVAQAD